MEDENPPFFVLCTKLLNSMPLTDQYSVITYSSSKGVTANTTPQTVVADPGTGNPVYVVEPYGLGVLNEDTTTKTLILTITGGTPRIVERVQVAAGSKWVNSSTISVAAGETLTLELSAVVTTSQLPWHVNYFQVTN